MTYHAKFVALVPHDVNIYDEDGLVDTIPSSGMVRITETWGETHKHPAGFTITDVTYAKSVSLPAQVNGTGIIVALPVANVLRATGSERTDVYTVGRPVYGEDKDGKSVIIGCNGLNHQVF